VQKLGAWVRLLNFGIAIYLGVIVLAFIDAFVGQSSKSQPTFLGLALPGPDVMTFISIAALIVLAVVYLLFTAVVVGIVRELRWPIWVGVLIGVAMNTPLWLVALVTVSVGSNRRLSRCGIRITPLGQRVPDAPPTNTTDSFGPALAARAIVPLERGGALRLLVLSIVLVIAGFASTALIGVTISRAWSNHG
jgi:hypothetical protein